jgi:hypothetical protein
MRHLRCACPARYVGVRGEVRRGCRNRRRRICREGASESAVRRRRSRYKVLLVYLLAPNREGASESAVRRRRSRYKVHLVYLVAPKDLRAACSARRRVIFHQHKLHTSSKSKHAYYIKSQKHKNNSKQGNVERKLSLTQSLGILRMY